MCSADVSSYVPAGRSMENVPSALTDTSGWSPGERRGERLTSQTSTPLSRVGRPCGHLLQALIAVARERDAAMVITPVQPRVVPAFGSVLTEVSLGRERF